MAHALITAEERPGYILVKLPGTISMDNYIEIEREINGLLHGANDRIVLDLSNTTNIYSSGMGLLIRLRKKVADGGGMLCLVNVTERCRILLASVHLDTMIPMYATDVEFEISQDDVWEKKTLEAGGPLILISRIEAGICRIALSGLMTAGRNLSALHKPLFDKDIRHYVFDLTGIEAADTAGVTALSEAVMAIHTKGGRGIAYGAPDFFTDLLGMLNLEDYLPCFAHEREALEAIGKA